MNRTVIITTFVALFIGVFIGFLIFKTDPKPRFRHNKLIGIWEGERFNLELRQDTTFRAYMGSNNFEGTWSLNDLIRESDTTTFIILENSGFMERQRDTFKYYWLEIEKVSNNTLRVIDRSGESRRNNHYKLKRDD